MRMPSEAGSTAATMAAAERREAALRGSAEDRYNYVEEIVVPIPQFSQAMDMLQTLFNATGLLDDPGGAIIYGDSGTGKSVICKKFASKHPTEQTPRGPTLPVLLLEMEQKVTAYSFLAGLLRKLGYPFSSGKNSYELADILAEGLRQRGVKLLLIDEAQESGEGRGEERPKEIANSLKRILDKSRVAQAFVGTHKGLRRFFTLGDQLATRVTVEHTLQPLQFDAQFIGILRSFDQALPTPAPSGLDAPEIAKGIHSASLGNFRRLRKLLAFAVLISAQQGGQSISREHLREAGYRAFGTGPNPFLGR